MNRSESNNLTRECITTALLIIIREKDYDEITITDITEKAGVSRMAYYRNYKSKDDILISRIREMAEEFFASILRDNINLEDLLIKVGLYFKENPDYITAVSKTGLLNSALDEIRHVVYRVFPSIKSSAEEQYATHFYTGAIISVMRYWFEAGMKESPEEIAAIICSNMGEKTVRNFENSKLTASGRNNR